mgnify:CR=1 FL=1
MVETKLPQTKLVEKIVSSIDEVKGIDVNLLDFREINNTVCGFFIICTGTSNTHTSAIEAKIKKVISKDLGEKPSHVEGNTIGEWILMDYFDVIVHIFEEKTRDFYNIEDLWGDAEVTTYKD